MSARLARLAMLACMTAMAACGNPQVSSPVARDLPRQVWVAVLGTADQPPEPLQLRIDEQAWDGYGGVVSLETSGPVAVRLIGDQTCREYASFTAEAGTNWVVRFAADESVAIEDWTGRSMDAGPALGEREPRECQATPSPSESPSPGAAAPRSPALVLPAWITERNVLPWCGHEQVERRTDGDFYDGAVRDCFVAAYEAGEAAEFATDGLTVEGGRIRSIYRSLGDGAIEVLLDQSGDPLATPAWSRASCTSLTEVGADPAGVPIFIGGGCSNGALIEREEPPADVTAQELRTIEKLIAFASQPSMQTADAVPWAAQVALGLADEVVASYSAAALHDPANWLLERNAFRGRVGPFSALETLAEWQGMGMDSITELAASGGPHPHCASPPIAGPAEVEELRRISVQPVGVTSCLTWWTVDLYLDDVQRVVAVTLDLFEP